MGEFFQVSELVKLIIIIVLARFFAEVRTDELSLQDLIKAGLIVGLPKFSGVDFEAARFGHRSCTGAHVGRRRISGGAAMETRRGYRINRRLDVTRRSPSS